MTTDAAPQDFDAFVVDAQDRVRRALTPLAGADAARQATTDGLVYVWQHWDRVAAMDNPAGYLYTVARSRVRLDRPLGDRLTEDLAGPDHEPSVEPALVELLASLTKRQRVAVYETDDCLRRLTDPTIITSTSQAPTTTMPLTTTSVGPVTEVPMTTTSITSLAAGVGYYVDVDLDCLAFELSGTWVLVDGDPRSWAPADERFEGGTFTLDSASTGTFRGDFAETKVATFRLLADDETPSCVPVPRYPS